MTTLKAWILAARPKTLPAAIAPVVIGCALAFRLTGRISWDLAWATLLSAMAIQIATNFFNDALDFEKGADTAERLGPTRATAAGLVSPGAMLWAGIFTLAVASALAVPLIVTRGWMILAIGLPSLYFSFGYTGGPLPLAYRGLGEAFVLLFFGLIAVSGTLFVQMGVSPLHGILAGLQLGLLSTVLIAVNNFRDMHEDRGTNKRTLAVRFGAHFARGEIWTCCLFPHILGLLFWPMLGLPKLAWYPLPVLILGALIGSGVSTHRPSPIFNKYLAIGGVQLVIFTVLFCYGVL